MCTLTLIATGTAYRLVHSRDEQRTRPLAKPPRVERFAGFHAVLPRDPAGGGTWVALRDDGAAMAIMNVNPDPPVPIDAASVRSRGEIIPALLETDAPWSSETLRRVDASQYAPFRLLCLSPRGEARTLTWRGAGVALVEDVPRTPAVWATSGLGDHVVEGPRRAVFARLVEPDPTAAAQDAFHRHTTPGMGYASVLMSREAARTVAITTIEVGDGPPVLRCVEIDGSMSEGAAWVHSPVRSNLSSAPF